MYVYAYIYMHACMVSCFSHVQLSVALWIVACQAPLSMGFSRQECWRGLLCPPPRDLPNPGAEPACLISPAFAGRFSTTSVTWEAHIHTYIYINVTHQ